MNFLTLQWFGYRFIKVVAQVVPHCFNLFLASETDLTSRCPSGSKFQQWHANVNKEYIYQLLLRLKDRAQITQENDFKLYSFPVCCIMTSLMDIWTLFGISNDESSVSLEIDDLEITAP